MTIGAADVVAKFVANVELAGIGESDAQRLIDAVMSVDEQVDAADFARLFATNERARA